MKKPTNERLAGLYVAWLGKTPPTFAGQFNEILPMQDFEGNQLKTLAKVTWNPLRDQYEMEPVEETSPGIFENTFLDIPEANYPDFLRVWNECGINTFHRLLIDGKASSEAPTTLPDSLFPERVETNQDRQHKI